METTLDMKQILTISFLIIFCFLVFLPLEIYASDQEEVIEELNDKLANLYLQIYSLVNQLNDLINSSPPFHSQTLGDYLKDLFEDQGVYLTKDDFLETPENPYLEYAKILNLIPSSYHSNQKISKKGAQQIKEKFLSIEDNLFLDGLYGKIDIHEHYRAGGDIETFLKVAGSLGISKIVLLPTGLGPDNQSYKIHQSFLIEYIKKLYPEKIIAFCTIDEGDSQAAEIFEQCLKNGGEGLKLIGGHPSFYDEPLNSENMYKVYKIAAEYKVPILIHGSIISIPEIKDQLDQVYSDFPEITFIHAHYCSTIMKGINLDQCAELLDKHPNLYFDLSMGGGIQRYHRYFQQDLAKVKDFILKYQDRILFGSDIILNPSLKKNLDWLYQRMKCDIDLHQEKEYICAFGEKDWLHQGFNLDKEVLRKLYFENPKKILNF